MIWYDVVYIYSMSSTRVHSSETKDCACVAVGETSLFSPIVAVVELYLRY